MQAMTRNNRSRLPQLHFNSVLIGHELFGFLDDEQTIQAASEGTQLHQEG